jgi:dipeptidyl aminopeptidase/acylaminoacyl peptidase
MLDLTQLLRTPQVDPLFDISPNNSKVAFAWNSTGEWKIYEMELNDPSHILPITSGGGGKFNPRYSPTGNKLAYALDIDGSESYHLVVYDSVTKTHKDLTTNISHALQPNFCWSPDGSQLGFLSDEPGHFSAYIMSVDGDSAQLVLDTGHPAWQVEWSPDGKYLAVSCEMHGQDYGIFIIDLDTREITKMDFNTIDPNWSPDGGKLAFQSDQHGWFDIGIYSFSTKMIEWVTQSEGDSQAPTFTETNIACMQSKGIFNWIEIGDVSGSRNKYQIGNGIHDGIKFTSDWKRMVCTFSSPSQPPDLWMLDVESGESTQLTKSLPEELLSEEYTLPEEFFYKSVDGADVPALLFRPKQTPAPAVVMIHGGPNWHYSAEWNPIMAHLASRGCIVLCPNYRGSTGYGRDWQYAAQFDMGGVDTRDVAAGAHYLLREGLANKIAVTGRSHGGYLTMTCLTQFPELWIAGSAVVPFTNWFKSHADSREDLKHWNIENMGDPNENYEQWYNASPYFFLDKIQAPVQMICGGNDPRCPAGDSIETHDKLLELGKDVELLLFEDEGHEFLKIENILESETKRVEFLARALGN